MSDKYFKNSVCFVKTLPPFICKCGAMAVRMQSRCNRCYAQFRWRVERKDSKRLKATGKAVLNYSTNGLAEKPERQLEGKGSRLLTKLRTQTDSAMDSVKQRHRRSRKRKGYISRYNQRTQCIRINKTDMERFKKVEGLRHNDKVQHLLDEVNNVSNAKLFASIGKSTGTPEDHSNKQNKFKDFIQKCVKAELESYFAEL